MNKPLILCAYFVGLGILFTMAIGDLISPVTAIVLVVIIAILAIVLVLKNFKFTFFEHK